MSKLIELIGRLGQQSAQPIGFGALTGRVEASPTMALIADASQGDFTGGIDEELAGVADAMLFMGAESESILANTFDESMIWGVSCEKLTGDELDVLEEAGCDYFVIDPQTAPAGVVGRPDVGTFVMMSEAADRETAVALRSLGVDGTLNTSAVGSGDLTFDSLVQLTKVGASTGGVMLVRVESDISLTDLGALRDAGVDSVVVSVRTQAGKDLLKQLAKSIRELPPRRRGESRRMQAAAPRSSD
jgi:hypothetical protein